MVAFIDINPNDALAHSELRVGLDVGGLYISSDPIGLQGGLNTYGYVGGSPLQLTDPKGLFAPLLAGALGGSAGAGVGVAVGGGGSWGASLGGLAIAGGISGVLAMAFGDDAAGNVDADSWEEFCGKCKATDTRSIARAKAYAYVGMSPGQGKDFLPWSDYNLPYGNKTFKRTKVYADFMQQNYQNGFLNFGEYMNKDYGVEEHALGHPDIPGGKNHDCPHFLAKKPGMPDMEFPYQPGTP